MPDRYYAVNDRPVKLVELPDGGMDCLVFDFATEKMVADRSYFEKVSNTGIGKEVDQLTVASFEARVLEIRQDLSRQRQEMPINWSRTGDGEFPYRAYVDRRTFVIRVNDFPAEALYTLLIDDREIEDLEDWPSAWIKPESPGIAHLR